MRVKGFCPMGCGTTLVVLADSSIACEADLCPRPFAVGELLADNEREHIVWMWEETYTVMHPLRERIGEDLFRCWIHRAIRDDFGPPREGPGVYRVRGKEDGELEYEKLGPLPRDVDPEFEFA